MKILLSLLFVSSVLLRTVRSNWRVKQLHTNEVTGDLMVGVPFQLTFSDENAWVRNNYNWFVSHPHCTSQQISNTSVQVVCFEHGVFPFGVRELPISPDKVSLLWYREILVRRSWKCFYWKVMQKIRTKRTFELYIRVSSYKEGTSAKDEEWSNKFNTIGESPHLVPMRHGGRGEQINTEFVTGGKWKAVVEMATTEFSLIVHIKSTNDMKAFDGCFIQTDRLSLTRPKYQSDEHQIAHQKMKSVPSMPLRERIVQDPCNDHVFMYLHSKQLHFSSGFQTIPHSLLDDDHPVDDIILTSNFTVYRKRSHLHAVSRTGDIHYVSEFKHSTGKIYTYRHSPLISSSRHDSFFVVDGDHFVKYDLSFRMWRHDPETICSNCFIEHMEMNVANDIAVLLVTSYMGHQQFLINYDLVDDQIDNSSKRILGNTTSLKEFRFLPECGLDLVLFSNNEVFILVEDLLVSKYRLRGNDGSMLQIIVSDSVLLATLSSGYIIYYEHGSSEIYKPYLGNSYAVAIDEVFYRIEEINDFNSIVIEPISLVVELGAATNQVSASILDFTISINNVVYYLDLIGEIKVDVRITFFAAKQSEVKVTFDTCSGHSSGMIVRKINENAEERNSIRQVHTSYLIKLDSNLNLLPRVNTITFTPHGFRGYAQPQLKPKTLFVKTGCPPGRHLRVRGPDIEAPKYYIYEALYFTVELYDENRYLRNVDRGVLISDPNNGNEGSDHIQVSSAGDYHIKYKVSANHTENGARVMMQFTSAGEYRINLKVIGFPSFCNLNYTVKLDIEPARIHMAWKWGIIGLELFIIIILLALSFVWFQRKTALEQAEDMAEQKRQDELRYLTTLRDYQEQMNVGANPVMLGVMRRNSSSVRRRSTIIPTIHTTDSDDSESDLSKLGSGLDRDSAPRRSRLYGSRRNSLTGEESIRLSTLSELEEGDDMLEDQ